MNKDLQISLITDTSHLADYDYNKAIFDLDDQIQMLSSQADTLDYFVSISSGFLCAMLDIFWTGDFDLARGREWGSDCVDDFVTKTAKLMGYKDEKGGIQGAVKFLEKHFHLAADGNINDFGGSKQHHLRDFSHHPTIVGLFFSLLTQFTEKTYGTDTNGLFIWKDVPESSKKYIGKDNVSKIIYGTVIWFFHLVSDMAGSEATAGLSGGTGIPGPILATAKELSALPIFQNGQVAGMPVSKFLSKVFNGTIFAEHDDNQKIMKDTIIRFDLRGELGLAEEVGRQALPVIANECIVRIFYFIRRLGFELKAKKIKKLSDLQRIDWDYVRPLNSPTLSRMLTISTGVFTTIDITEAVASQKYFVAVNYPGVGRFLLALGNDMHWALKRKDVCKIRQMYEQIKKNTFDNTDQKIYERMGEAMDIGRMGLTEEQTEILYNLEYFKTVNDINCTGLVLGKNKVMDLKHDWVIEWTEYMTYGYSSFLQSDEELTWHTLPSLYNLIMKNDPSKPWFRLVLLEAMLFEPYYPLSLEKDKNGNEFPSKKYNSIHTPLGGYSKAAGDKYLDDFFSEQFLGTRYVKRLRKSYDKTVNELNEVLKTAIASIAITAGLTLAAVATAGVFAPAIAAAVVGSNFAGLSGVALTNACLAYLGGGAIAAGGLGMTGGTAVIVGGSAVLGLGVGAGVGGVTGSISLMGKKNTILQSAKLMVSVKEIFLNDEHDVAFSDAVYEQYVENITRIEKDLVELRIKAETADPEEKKALKAEIKRAEESVNAMKVAMKYMNKFNSSFKAGMNHMKENINHG